MAWLEDCEQSFDHCYCNINFHVCPKRTDMDNNWKWDTRVICRISMLTPTCHVMGVPWKAIVVSFLVKVHHSLSIRGSWCLFTTILSLQTFIVRWWSSSSRLLLSLVLTKKYFPVVSYWTNWKRRRNAKIISKIFCWYLDSGALSRTMYPCQDTVHSHDVEKWDRIITRLTLLIHWPYKI